MTPAPPATDSYDAVVVGGGPAGLAAGAWLARYRRAVLLVDSAEYRSAAVERSHGYLGRDPQRPMDLLAVGRDEFLAYPTARYRRGRVTELAGRRGAFRLTLADRSVVPALRVVLATGVADVLPDLAGASEHYGAGLFHCPACDGYEARDRDVVVLGWDERLVGFCLSLLNWARSVTLITAGRRFAGDERCTEVLARYGVPVVEEPAAEICGPRGSLHGVRLAGGRVIPATLVFFSVAHRPRLELALVLGAERAGECLLVNDCGETTVPGLYAAGDVVPGLHLVSVAAAKGVVAGIGAAQSLHGERGSAYSPNPAPDIAEELGTD